MSAELLELADRCEVATGLNRELDTAIRCAIFAPEGCTVELSPINGAYYVANGTDKAGRPRPHEWRGLTFLQRTGEFTASIDAALTLVPEGHWAEGSLGSHIDQRSSLEIHAPCTFDPVGRATAATPALALCAAALRARAASLSGGAA